MIRNVIFDLGKVLIDYNFDKFFISIGNEPNTRTLDEANKEILLFEAGKIDKYSFYNEMKRIYGFDIDFETFKSLWCDVFWELPEMINFVKELKRKNYNIFIFSNTDEIHFPYILDKFPSIDFFADNLMLSYQLGYVKPDINIYKEAIKRFDIIPEESLFIDDRLENVLAAEKVGFTVVHHKNFETSYRKIKKNINLEDK